MVNKATPTDEQLVLSVRDGDKASETLLYEKYKPLVKSRARSYFLVGADHEDLIQEGMIGLYNAVCDYSPDKQAAFSTFAELCITRRIITAIKNANRQKHMPLNGYISFNNTVSNETGIITYVDTLPDEANPNPEDLLIFREEKSLIEKSLLNSFSKHEYEVFLHYLNGLSYDDISELTGKNSKSVDNALQRVRKKLTRLLTSEQ